MGTKKVCKNPDNSVCTDEGFLIHKMGRQVVAPILETAPSALNATGEYRIFKSWHLENPNSARFNGYAQRLYDPKYLEGHILEKTIPDKYKPLEDGNINMLKKSGLRMKIYAMSGDTAIRIVRVGIDIGAITSCASNKCSQEEWVAILSDSFVSGTETTALSANALGTHLYRNEASSLTANKLLTVGQKITRVVGGLQILSGLTRIYIETEHYMETGDANTSAGAYAFSDVFYGGYQIVRSNYLLKMAGQRTLTAKASRMLAVNDVVYTMGTRVALRGLGIAGVAAGLGINAYTIYDNIYNNKNVSEEIRTKNIISGIVGFSGNLIILGSVLIVAPPLYPVSLGLFILGTGVLIGQGIYDHNDEFGETVITNDMSALKDCSGILATGNPYEFECVRSGYESSVYVEDSDVLNIDIPQIEGENINFEKTQEAMVVLPSEEDLMDYPRDIVEVMIITAD